MWKNSLQLTPSLEIEYLGTQVHWKQWCFSSHVWNWGNCMCTENVKFTASHTSPSIKEVPHLLGKLNSVSQKVSPGRLFYCTMLQRDLMRSLATGVNCMKYYSSLLSAREGEINLVDRPDARLNRKSLVLRSTDLSIISAKVRSSFLSALFLLWLWFFWKKDKERKTTEKVAKWDRLTQHFPICW